MKNFFCIIVCLLFFSSCSDVHKKSIDILEIPLEYAKFNIHNIDSTKILNPKGLYCYKDYVIMIEPKNNPVFSFWNSKNLQYCFSDGFIGNGPNEFINPRSNYFAATDSSFFILDSNIEWEVQTIKNSIQIINKEPIIIPDAINQLIRLTDKKYLMAGNTDGKNNAEHILYDANIGEYTYFGKYPSKNIPNERKFIFDFKYTAGRDDKPYIWDFYENHNLIRQYDLEGKLLQEIQLKNIEKRHNSDSKSSDQQNRPFWMIIQTTSKHIYALFYTGETIKNIYSEGAIPELQEWDWQGNLIRRILFNKKYDHIAVSENEILYAINTIDEFNYQIYSYEL